jgi:hypothetical protein
MAWRLTLLGDRAVLSFKQMTSACVGGAGRGSAYGCD